MRSKLRSWDNRKALRKNGQYMGWTRRLFWYADWEGKDIRIKFEDETGTGNRFYKSEDEASRDWERFRDGVLTVADIWRTGV